MLNIMGSVAEFERSIMLERQREGIAKAKANGKFKGRAPTAQRKAREVIELRSKGIKADEIANRLEISRASVFRILKSQGTSALRRGGDRRGTGIELPRLIIRLPELVELERDRNKAKSRRRSPPLHRPVTLGDLARDGKLLEVECSACRPCRHLYIEPLSLGLPKRLPVPDVANHLVCSVCGARNDELKRPIHARPDARVPGVTGKYPRW